MSLSTWCTLGARGAVCGRVDGATSPEVGPITGCYLRVVPAHTLLCGVAIKSGAMHRAVFLRVQFALWRKGAHAQPRSHIGSSHCPQIVATPLPTRSCPHIAMAHHLPVPEPVVSPAPAATMEDFNSDEGLWAPVRSGALAPLSGKFVTQLAEGWRAWALGAFGLTFGLVSQVPVSR